MQKVKHLEYEHGNNCNKVDLSAKGNMKLEHGHHQNNEKDMRKEKSS
jgi:hypothetical protein